MIACVLLSAAVAVPSAYEVFVSPTGSDAASGLDPTAPVNSLRRARDLLRGAPRPATVHVGAGDYFLGNESLSLGRQDGGGVRWEGSTSNGSSVVYSGTRVVGWKKHGDGDIYRAPWTSKRFFALTEGRYPAALARHPDPGSGYIALTQKNGDTVGWVPGTVPNFTCTEAHQCQAYLQCNYFAEVHNVALGSVNLSTSSLKYEQEPHCSMHIVRRGSTLQARWS